MNGHDRRADPVFNLKLYRQGSEILLAVCDHELVGREFREGNLRLAPDTGFYGADVTDAETVRQHLRLATIGNLVGRGAVDLAIDQGVVDAANVLEVDGVPHAQFAVHQDPLAR